MHHQSDRCLEICTQTQLATVDQAGGDEQGKGGRKTGLPFPKRRWRERRRRRRRKAAGGSAGRMSKRRHLSARRRQPTPKSCDTRAQSWREER